MPSPAESARGCPARRRGGAAAPNQPGGESSGPGSVPSAAGHACQRCELQPLPHRRAFLSLGLLTSSSVAWGTGMAFPVPRKVKEKVCWASVCLGVRLGLSRTPQHTLNSGVPGHWLGETCGWAVANGECKLGRDPAPRPRPGCLQVFRGRGGARAERGQYRAVGSHPL